MIIAVTLCAAASAAIINAWLSIRIGSLRGKLKISVGDGGDDLLQRRMRAHSNFAENTPLVLVLIAAIELARGANPWLGAAAGIFLLCRVAHGIGMDGGARAPARVFGALVTMLTQIALAVWAISIVLDM